jgi:glycosyltransferase involved in cell wall biosynthesis
MTRNTITYSVVIPLKDEEDNIPALVGELEPVMEALGRPWELVCIDDGSTDGTRAVLRDLRIDKPYIRILAFAGNYGQSSAFDAGFRAARGEFVITLDGDLQNDPSDIPRLLKEAEKCDLVCGIRTRRQDSWFKRLISRTANSIRSRLLADGMRDTGCSLKIYRRECLEQIKIYHGLHRFLPALFRIEGFRTAQVEVNHRPRTSGKSKYSIFNRSFNTITDLLAVMWMRRRHLHYAIEQEIPPRSENG